MKDELIYTGKVTSSMCEGCGTQNDMKEVIRLGKDGSVYHGRKCSFCGAIGVMTEDYVLRLPASFKKHLMDVQEQLDEYKRLVEENCKLKQDLIRIAYIEVRDVPDHPADMTDKEASLTAALGQCVVIAKEALRRSDS